MLLCGVILSCLHQSSSEVAEARDWLAGRLTEDFVFEQLGNHCYDNLHQLDCPHLGIKVVDLSPPAKFNALLRYPDLPYHYTMTIFIAL